MRRSAWFLLSAALAVACSSSNPRQDSPTPDTAHGPDIGQAEPDAASDVDTPVDTPVYDPAEWYTLQSEPFVVPTGEERFYCYSFTVTEDLAVSEIKLDSLPVVHHVVLSRTTSPDPEGFFECDVLFQNNWVPVFVAGTGDASLTMPEGAGFVIPKGTQLTMQLHLLNPLPSAEEQVVPIRLRRAQATEIEPVSVVVFGSTNVQLPPLQASQVVGGCTPDEEVSIFAAFPHMHLLGTAMTVEVGPDDENLAEVFRRDPYDFDDQHLEELALTLSPGQRVRVTCSYDNPHDQTITFGESTMNEMCFFIGFATGAGQAMKTCLSGGSGGNFFPPGCGEDPPNQQGIGAACTAGGGECPAGTQCSQDLAPNDGPGVCLTLGCGSSAECGGGGAFCCSIPQAGDLTLCLPESCQIPACQVVP